MFDPPGFPMHYFAIYKPYGFLSQFTREEPHHAVLGDLHAFAKDVYPLGRLDRDSEGLLLLTNDRSQNHRLLHPSHQHRRRYWAQVEGSITSEAVNELETGVQIRFKGKTHQTRPAQAEVLAEPQGLPERNPPIRARKSIPTSWIQLELTEGKNRQVRRMCAAVGFPVLRLIRVQIGHYRLPEFRVGGVWQLTKAEWEKAFS
jgi:23S rRNA pseudouridine2457 synthase